MIATPTHPVTPRRRLPFSLVACLIFAGIVQADDRFFVPVAPSDNSPPPSSPPPSPPSGGGSSGSSGGSGSSSGNDSGTRGADHGAAGGRFFVPMPGHAGGGGHGGGGAGGGGGGGYYDPYWGGCYYRDGCYHYWHGYGPWGSGYPYNGYTTTVIRVPYRYPFEMRGPVVFFPPEPPPLGNPLPDAPPFHAGQLQAPAPLQEFLTASFYPQLSSRLYRANLSKRQLQDVDAYRASRRALLEELRTRLSATHSLAPLARTHEHEALAASQQSRLVALEQTAETLRTELLRGGLIGAMGESGDWNQGRTWRLGSTSLGSSREQTLGLEFRVMRAAAFYQEGLSPGQRRLLREIAAELQADAYQPRGRATPSASGDSLIYFSPAMSRVRFARDLPGPITSRLEAYTTEREAIKAELRDVVYTRDTESRSARTTALRELARDHEPRLATLDFLADEIRNEIAALGRPLRSAPLTAPPPELAARLAGYRTTRGTLQLELDMELSRLRTRVVSSDAEAEATIRESIAEFSRAHKAAYDDLEKSRAALRADLSAHYAAGPRTISSASIDAVLNAADEAHEPDALWQRYTEYAVAIFLPGLSPQQRQLLFDGALEQLDLPLPEGERMP